MSAFLAVVATKAATQLLQAVTAWTARVLVTAFAVRVAARVAAA